MGNSITGVIWGRGRQKFVVHQAGNVGLFGTTPQPGRETLTGSQFSNRGQRDAEMAWYLEQVHVILSLHIVPYLGVLT